MYPIPYTLTGAASTGAGACADDADAGVVVVGEWAKKVDSKCIKYIWKDALEADFGTTNRLAELIDCKTNACKESDYVTQKANKMWAKLSDVQKKAIKARLDIVQPAGFFDPIHTLRDPGNRLAHGITRPLASWRICSVPRKWRKVGALCSSLTRCSHSSTTAAQVGRVILGFLIIVIVNTVLVIT